MNPTTAASAHAAGHLLRVPRIPLRLLPPAPVVAVLDAGHPVTVLRAPHGYGKSAVVASWLATSGSAASWCTVLEATRDLQSLVAQLVLVLGRVDGTLDASSTSEDASLENALCEAVTAHAQPLVLVLDRYERVSAPGAEPLLARVVERCPSLTLVLCCHSLSDVRLARLGVDAAVVGPDELALDSHAVDELARALGTALAPGRAAAIHDALWGWPAPIRAVLSTQPVAPEGTTGVVLDWTVMMVHVTDSSSWSHTAATDEFLLRTRILDTVTADVADHLTQRTDSAVLLDQLETAGLARSVHHGAVRTFEYLPALRTAHTRVSVPDSVEIERDAHRRARELFTDHPERAIVHAAASDDWDDVLSIADTHVGNLLAHHPQPLRAALLQIPGRFFRAMPRLLVIRDLFLYSRTDAAGSRALRWPENSSDLDDGQVRDLTLAAIGQTVALRRAFRFRDALDVVDRLQDTVKGPDGHWHDAISDVLAFVLVQSGVVRFMAGDVAGARTDFLHAYRSGRGTDLEFIARHSLEFTALLDVLHGEVSSALAWLDLAQRLAPTPAALRRVVDPLEPLVRALAAIDKLEIDDAEAWLSRVPTLENAQAARLSAWFVRDCAAATIAHLRGNPSLALTLLDNARHQSGGRVIPESFAYRHVTQVQVWLTLWSDNPTRAQNLLRAYPMPRESVLRAQLALQTGDPSVAIETATTGLLRAGTSRAERVMLHLVDMAARHTVGALDAAVQALRNALALADEGVLRPFAEARRDVLDDLADRVPEIRAVLDAVDASAAAPLPVASATIIDLSDREIAVLEALERSSSAEVLARHLFVSPNTVKTQTRTLYRKLGVTNRESALGAGHALGYLGLTATD